MRNRRAARSAGCPWVRYSRQNASSAPGGGSRFTTPDCAPRERADVKWPVAPGQVSEASPSSARRVPPWAGGCHAYRAYRSWRCARSSRRACSSRRISSSWLRSSASSSAASGDRVSRASSGEVLPTNRRSHPIAADATRTAGQARPRTRSISRPSTRSPSARRPLCSNSSVCHARRPRIVAAVSSAKSRST